jgi:hypothetical protein
LAAITMPSPRRPPPTHTGRPSSLGSSAISQLAKKESPSMCKMRLLRALIGSRHATASLAAVHSELFTTASLPHPPGQCLSNQKTLTAVTNARIAAPHGRSVGPLPARPCPCRSAKPRARHKRRWIGRISGGLPSAARRRCCAPAPFQPSLRLRFTASARRPQTEAFEGKNHHAFVLSELCDEPNASQM